MSQLAHFETRSRSPRQKNQNSFLSDFLKSLVPLSCAVAALSYLMTIPPY